MTTVLWTILPVFGLLAAGFLARRTGLLSERAEQGLSEYVYVLAIPALLFRSVVSVETAGASPWAYWAAFFAGVAITWAVVSLIAARGFGRGGREVVLAGFTAAQANTVMVGIPMIVLVFGEAGKAPIVWLLAVHLPINMLAATLLIEASGDRPLSERLRGFAGSLVRHPILVAIAMGAALKVAGLTPPAPAMALVGAVADTTITVSLIAMGAALVRYGLAADAGLAATVAAAKLLLHPALVLLFGLAIGLDPVWLGVAVLFAAAPPGINTYLFAARHGVAEAMTSSAIGIGTLASVVTVAGWLLLLQATRG